MRVRPLDEQFGNEIVLRLRAIQRRVLELQDLGILQRYVAVEIAQCLEAGLLIAGLQVACSALEFAVRLAVVKDRDKQATGIPDADRAIFSSALLTKAEDDPQLTFGRMLAELVNHYVLTMEEKDHMQNIYRVVRIPVQHGILGRYVRERFDPSARWLLELSSFNPAQDSHAIEEQIEKHAMDEIEELLSQIELLSRKHAFQLVT